MIGTELKRYQPERRYCCGDFETEGVNLFASRPWQLAYLIADSKTVHEVKNEFIWWPDLNMSKQAAIITNFNAVEYKAKARPPAEVCAEFEARLYDTSLDIVGHNFFFDGYIHNTLRRLLGKKPDWSWMSRLYDTDALSRAYRKGIAPDLTNMLAFQYKMQSLREKLKTKLGNMCTEFSIEYNPAEAHRADYDILKTRAVYEALKWKMEF
jgi:hypothetical protein